MIYFNILQRKHIFCIVAGLFFLFTVNAAHAQTGKDNKYGLIVVSDAEQYKKQAAQDSNQQMTDLHRLIPSIVFELHYASVNNFTGQQLYPSIKTTYTRLPVAKALLAIQDTLRKQGLGLKIFDAYRPYAVTEKMWELIKDDRYVADPSKGSGHNRGIAVDLTIVQLQTGKELDMGTGFDNFTDTAHHNFTHLPEAVLHNRLLLKELMEQHGFKALDTEWWHYSLPNAKDFAVLDLSFKQLRKLSIR